jgi:hypothetical protein
VTFNEIEITISINIRNLSEKITILIIFIEIIEIIENAPNISDTDIANANDINIIFENIENTFFKNIIIESAPVRKSIRHRKAIFKTVKANIVTANIVGIAETSIISADEGESEEKNYLSKAIIAKTIIANENKSIYEKAITDSKKF